MDAANLPIVLLPGLNGDSRVLRLQAAAFPSLTVAQWIPPLKSESIAAYAERLARSLNTQDPCLIGGVSFGGIVALEMARHLQVRACMLIASSQDAGGLPLFVRLLRPVAAVTPPAILRWAIRLGFVSASSASLPLKRRLTSLSSEELAFRRWALGALLTWQFPKYREIPVFQIHGERDSTFSASRSKADLVVPGAGHMVTLTHARQVNEFLRAALQNYEPSSYQ